MLCPQCGGTDYEVVSPNMLRCTARVIVNAVPPGMNSNMSGVPIPIWGDCDTEAPAEQWIAAAREAEAAAVAARTAQEQRQAAFEAERAHRAELERRKKKLLVDLRSRGNPGIQSRLVAGRYHLSIWARIFGRVGRDVHVVVTPAWKFGTCTWVSEGMRGTDNFENCPTGITPDGLIVPMNRAAPTDDVEYLYSRRKLWEGFPAAPGGFRTRAVDIEDVVRALEKAAAGH